MRHYTSTPMGLNYREDQVRFWYQISVCPECGKKLEPENGLVVPHKYICEDCYWTSARYHQAVDDEPNLYNYPQE